MKKFTFLFFMMALICGVTFAQTQDNPLELNTTEVNVYSGSTYYTYTAPSTSNVYLTLDFGKYANVTVSDESGQNLGSTPNNDWSAFTYAIPASQKVLIYVSDWYSEGGEFKVTVEETNDDFEGGATCDDAVLVTEKSTYLNSHYDNTNYTSLAYATFQPETSGNVKIFIDGYSSYKYISVGCEGEKEDLNALAQNDPAEGTYYPYTVEAGVTYILTLQNGGTSPYHIKVVPVDDSEGASCNNPFTSTDGTFTLPAAAGTYWYQYDIAKTDGFVTITSDANLGSGKAVFLTSCTGYAFTTSNGCVSMRKRIGTDSEYEEPLSTVYFAVVKTEATAADEQITVKEEDLQPGDAKTYPKEIVADTEYSTPGFAGATYYKFTVPADFTSAMYANVNYTIEGVSSTSLILNDEETGSQLAYVNSDMKVPVENGKSYILTVNSYNAENVSFKLTFTEIPAGAEYLTAIQANLGENTLKAGSTYYKYTATKGCFLKVDTGDAWTTMSFPKSANSYESYDITSDGTGYKIAAAEGKTYVFYIQNIATEGTFILSEIDVKAGEIEANPIKLESGVSADIPAEAFKTTYYGFTTTKRGILDLRTDMPYEYDYNTYQASSMQYKSVNDNWYQWINGSAEGYITTLPTEAGMSYYIKTFTLNDTQYKLTATEYAFDELPAIPAETGATLDVPVKTNNNYKDWYYLNIPKAGKFTLYAEGKSYADFQVYSTSDLSSPVASTDVFSSEGVYYTTLTFHADTASEYAVALTSSPGYNGEGTTFTVTFEKDATVPGTTEDEPIVLTSGETADVPAGVGTETYFSFTTSKNGIIDIRTDMPYQYNEETYSSTAMYVMSPADDYYKWTNGSATEGFILTAPCTAEQTYKIKTQTLDETQYHLTATEYAFCELPAIPTENGAEWTVAVKPNSNYKNWYYLNIPSEGTFSLKATGKTYANVSIYSISDLNTVVAESKVVSEGTEYTTTLKLEATEAGEYVVAVPTCMGWDESDVVFTVSFNNGNTDGISNINTAADANAEVYDMSGRKVTSDVRAASLKRGAYIVKGSNGNATKVMLGK